MQRAVTFPVQNMSCGSCVGRVKSVLSKIEGATQVEVNLAGETAQLTASQDSVITRALTDLDHAGYGPRTTAAEFQVTGLSCASCVARLDQALSAVPGVTDATVNLVNNTAQVTFVPGVVTFDDLFQAATAAGYPLEPISDLTEQDDHQVYEAQATRLSFWIAAALTLPVFILEMGAHISETWHHLIWDTIGQSGSWALQFILTTLVLVGPGRTFFLRGGSALWHRTPTMDSLVALGAGAAWLYSTVALFLPQALPAASRAVYFEAAAVIVTLILLGRWFEQRAKGRTGAALRKLVGLQPRTALKQIGDDWVEVPVAKLQVGDVLLLHPGARVPTDASVISGTSYVDESMLTGEPMQVSKSLGDALTGGSVNGEGSLTCRVEKVGKDTTLAHIIRMVQQAQAANLPIQALVDRVTLWFVPMVMVIAVVTFLAWLFVGPSLSHALVAGVSVLIIACPCAMGLATPTSIMVGTGRAAELGVLFRKGDALQSLSDVTLVALDKTGTLTMGTPSLTSFSPLDAFEKDALLAQIAAVEQHSEHPIARAILQGAEGTETRSLKASNIEVVAGQGIIGQVDAQKVAVGNRRLMATSGIDISSLEAQAKPLENKGQTVVFASVDGLAAAVLGISDPLRSSARATIKALKSQGLKIAMITGDGPSAAQAIADELGITTVVSDVLPEGKMQALKELRNQHGKVAFVGDGINDAPVLAEADVGIAIGTGTDVAIETADVVLMSGDLTGVRNAFDLSRATLLNIKENLGWAFGYNTLLIPVAAGVLYPAFGWLLSPGLAAGAMAFSSVFVLGNALRLRVSGGAT